MWSWKQQGSLCVICWQEESSDIFTKGQGNELGWRSDQEQNRRLRGTHPDQRRQRQTWEDRGSGVRKSSHRRPKDETQQEQENMMGRWRKLHSFLCHPTLFCFVSANSTHPPVVLTALHCTARISVCLDCLRNIVASVRVCEHSVSKASSVIERSIDQCVCVFHPIGCLWLLPCVCRTKLPVTFISALVVLWSVSAADRLYQPQPHSCLAFTVFYISPFLHISFPLTFPAFVHTCGLFHQIWCFCPQI